MVDRPLIVTNDPRVSQIFERSGDIAEVMEVFGVKRVGPLSLRRLRGKFLSVERAAKVQGVPLEQLLARQGGR